MAENQLIPGFHATRDALLSDHIGIHEIWVADGRKGSRVADILNISRRKGIPARVKQGVELDRLLPGVNHQGIVALAGKFQYADLDGLAANALKGDGYATLIAADHITDEGNLGALIRTGAFFGAHGLLLPKKRSAAVTPRVVKGSAGGSVYFPVARVTNMARALDSLSRKGFWVVGAAGEGPESVFQFDWQRDLVLVLGSEGHGLSRVVGSRCHQIVRIPGFGHVDSLNVSVAGGVILSEIARQRGLPKEAGESAPTHGPREVP